MVFEYVWDNQKVETEIFIHSIIGKIIILENNSDEFVNDIMKSFKDEYKEIDKQMEGSRFSFIFFSRYFKSYVW